MQPNELLNRVASIICDETCGLTSECKSREAAKALFDKGYLTTPEAKSGVVVKQLEWVGARISTMWEHFEAQSIVGRYEALEWSDGTFGGTIPPIDPDEHGTEFTAPTMEDAKAVAQSDFERRILSALDHAAGKEGGV